MQEEFIALLADYNQSWESDPLLTLIFFSELKSARDSVQVQSLGVVKDHTVHKPNWFVPGRTSCKPP